MTERLAEPVSMTTYKHPDKELIYDEFGWVTDLEYFEDTWRPVDLVKEVWIRESVEDFTYFPTIVYACEWPVNDDACEEDAHGWRKNDEGEWQMVCDAHEPEVRV